MAAFDSTLGGAFATSYQSLEDADALYAGSLNDAEWLAFDDTTRKAGLMAAATYLDTLDWDGSVCFVPASDNATQPQALQWPRTGVACRGIDAVCTAIPANILKAQAYLALQLAKDPTLINPDPNPVPVGLYVKRNKLDALEQEFEELKNDTFASRYGSDQGLIKKFPWILDLVGCWIKSRGTRIIARVRS